MSIAIDGFDTIITQKAKDEGVTIANRAKFDGFNEIREEQFDFYTEPKNATTNILVVRQDVPLCPRNKILVLGQNETAFIPQGYCAPQFPHYSLFAGIDNEKYIASFEAQQEALSRYSI